MTDKEKKAIERCNELIKEQNKEWLGITNQIAITNILNLIEKQQKEIYELKNQTQIISSLYVKEKYILKEAIREKIEDIEDYFYRLNVPDEDIEFIREKRKEILGE